MRKHRVPVEMRPVKTLRRLLVRNKEKRQKEEAIDCVQGWINHSGAPYQHKAGAPTATSCGTWAMSRTMRLLPPTFYICMAKVSNTRRTESGSRFLQTRQRAHRHHAARHGSREKYLGAMSPKYRGAELRELKARESSVK